jgi:predicted amino acid dehydrogenase
VSRDAGDDAARATARLQAAVFGLGGLWSVVHRRSFEAVTGPKVDYWLVRTVGLLLTAVAVVLWRAAGRDRLSPDTRVLGASSAAALLAIDVRYVAKRRIRRVYLLDALAQAGILAGWARSRTER